jgi:hypothetical protein
MPVTGIVRSPVPANACELLSEVRALVAAGASQETAIEYVYDVAARLSLRVCHDQHELHPAEREGGAPGEPASEPDSEPADANANDSAGANVNDSADANVNDSAVANGAADANGTVGGEAPCGTGAGPAASETSPADGTDSAPESPDEAGAPRDEINAAPEPAAETDAAAVDPAAVRRATGRGARRRNRKRAPIVGASTVRQPDGSHILDLGCILGLRAAPDTRPEEVAPVRGRTVGRLVLSCDRRGGGRARGLPDSALRYESNGLVVDARTWRALAVPPGAFNPRANTRMVDTLLADHLYDIVRVDDGTIVTLYCWAHPTEGAVWALASSGGYDVSSLRWLGDLTYAGVFHDLATRIYPAFAAATGLSLETRPGGVTRLAFTRLDPSCCYTVGFRHHAFHPLIADPERMWQVQCTDLSGELPRVAYGAGTPQIGKAGGVTWVGLPHVPAQHVLSDAELADMLGGQPVTCERLRALGRDALTAASAFVGRIAANAGPMPAAGAPPPAALAYGFILRTRDPARTGEHGDVLLETPLLARVRKIVYERAPLAVRDHLTAADRLEYNAMRAFLTAGDRADFRALFPGWGGRLDQFEQFVNNVVSMIIHALRQRAMAPASREPTMRTPTGQVAAALLAHIRQFEDLATFNKHTQQIVHDYVVNPEYAFLFLRAMRLGA